MGQIIKIFCPGCNKAYKSFFAVDVLPRDLDPPPCHVCGGPTELDVSTGSDEVKAKFYTKKRYKKFNTWNKKDVVKSGKGMGMKGYQEASD